MMMEKSYSIVAPFYDYLLRHVNYQEWYDYISTNMKRNILNPEIVVELGCGTGKFGAKFSNDEYNVYGIDNSLEMLKVAKTRVFFNYRIFCADIRNFNLARKADFIFSVHDTINYLTEPADVKKVFQSVKRNISKEGIFFFDITTRHNIMSNFHGKTAIYSTRGNTIEWSNIYEEHSKIIYSTIKIVDKNNNETVEQHAQKIYSINEIKELLEEEGFEIIHILGDYTFLPPTKETIMINFVTRLKK